MIYHAILEYVYTIYNCILSSYVYNLVDAELKRRVYEMSSFAEQKAMKAAKNAAREFVLYNARCVCAYLLERLRIMLFL